VPSWMEKISNKSRYSISQGIRRKFKSKNMSPYIRGHCKNPEGCLHRVEVIARIQKDVSLGSTSLGVAGWRFKICEDVTQGTTSLEKAKAERRIFDNIKENLGEKSHLHLMNIKHIRRYYCCYLLIIFWLDYLRIFDYVYLQKLYPTCL